MKYLDARLHEQQWPLETLLSRAIPGLELVYEAKAIRVFAIPVSNISPRSRTLLDAFCETAEYEANPVEEESQCVIKENSGIQLS